jgi:hypothetical protein
MTTGSWLVVLFFVSLASAYIGWKSCKTAMLWNIEAILKAASPDVAEGLKRAIHRIKASKAREAFIGSVS